MSNLLLYFCYKIFITRETISFNEKHQDFILSLETNLTEDSNDQNTTNNTIAINQSTTVVEWPDVNVTSEIISNNSGSNENFSMTTPLSGKIGNTFLSSVKNASVGLHMPKLICHEFFGRLGNEMFQYASVLGLTFTMNRISIFRSAKHLFRILKTPAQDPSRQKELDHNCTYASVINEVACCKFDQKLTKLDPNQNYMVYGYLMSWKYFIDHETRIKKALTFSEDVVNKSMEIVNRLRENNFQSTLIGVHVRHGDDYATFSGKRRGYVSASAIYLKRSFSYFRNRFPNSVFIIATDDMTWCRSNVPEGFQVMYLKNNYPAVDMTILSQLDHVVITVGTFSWWCGYLNAGTVVYFKDFILPNTSIGQEYLPDGRDYIYPRWIPL